jgi:hypothetical protein
MSARVEKKREGMLVAKPGIRDIVVRFVRVRPRPVEEGIRPKDPDGGPLTGKLLGDTADRNDGRINGRKGGKEERR